MKSTVVDFESVIAQRIADKIKLRETHISQQRQHELAAYSLTGSIAAFKESLAAYREVPKGRHQNPRQKRTAKHRQKSIE